jgi:proton glutamate symport protein
MPLINRIIQRLKSPWLALISIVLGSYVGLFHQSLAESVTPVGDIYLALLEMFILPIVVTALIHAIGHILMGGMCGRCIRRVVLVFGGGMVIAALVAMMLGSVFSPGAAMAEDSKKVLGETIIQYEQGNRLEQPPHGGQTIVGFMQLMIPGNIFKAASVGNSLALVFFCIITGIALGSLNNEKARTALRVFEAIYDALMKIITWIMYALPIGLFCLVAGKLAALGTDVLVAMGGFVAVFYAGSIVLITGYLLLTAWRGKAEVWRAAQAVKEPLIVALGTSSNLAAIPAALRALTNGLRREPVTTSLVIPLGMNINLQGSVFYFTLGALFTTQLYGRTLSPEEYLLLPIAGIFAAIAASDAPGIAGIGMISILLEPLGVPVGVTIILLSVIDPLIDPVVSVTDVYGNCAAAVLITDEANSS